MIRAVLDANTILSGIAGFTTRATPPPLILQASFRGEFELLISMPLWHEITRALSKPYFVASVGASGHASTLVAIQHRATFVAITAQVHGVASHPEDDLVLAAAASANADRLVTGDKDLLALGAFRQIPIVSPRDILTELDRLAGR